MATEKTRVCPVECSGSLDNQLRRWLQNPNKILAPFVREGMSVLEVGCGPGFFSLELARLVGESGNVVSADLQEGMLEKVRERVMGTGLEKRIHLVKCDQDRINVSGTFDFVLLFYMVHEVPRKDLFFQQLKPLLKPDGRILLVEPKLFHVSAQEFKRTTQLAEDNGFVVSSGPKLTLSWSAILSRQ